MSDKLSRIGANTHKPLASLADCQKALVSLCRDTRKNLDIFSHRLDLALYDQSQLEQAASELARAHRLAQIRILVIDTQTLIDYGHGLVRLAIRLPSKIQIRKATELPETKAAGFCLGDTHKLVYLASEADHQGFYDTQAGPEVRSLREAFNRAWDLSEEEPRFKQFFI